MVNNVTGANDRSDAPFTLLPRAVDVKVNGSDGPVTLSNNEKISVTWTSTGNRTFCDLGGVRQIPDGNNYIPNMPPSGTLNVYAAVYPDTANQVWVGCRKSDGSGTVYDFVAVNPSSSATLQVVAPNGGEKIELGKPYTILFSMGGVSQYSIALYKNDQWYHWILKDVPVGKEGYVWTPSLTEYGTDLGPMYKIYITGQKADGTGYVDDKSDAPFSFIASTTPAPLVNLEAGYADYYKSANGVLELPFASVDDVTLWWRSTSVSSCAITPILPGYESVGGKVPINGAASTGRIDKTTTYTITCARSDGQGSVSDSLMVRLTPPPNTGRFSISVSSTPAPQKFVPGAADITVARMQFDASSSLENVRVPGAMFIYTDNAPVDPTNCFAYNGTTRLNSAPINPNNSGTTSQAYTFAFDSVQFTAAKGTVKTVAIKCAVPYNAPAGSFSFGLQSGVSVIGTGATSKLSIAPTVATNPGNKMTIAGSSGTLAVSNDPSTPAYQIAVGGATDFTLGSYKFTAKLEDVKLDKIGLALAKETAYPGDLVNMYLYDGSTLIGTATFIGNNYTAVSALSQPVTVAKNSSKTIVVKGDFANIGTGQPGRSGDLIKVSIVTSSGQTSGTGASSGSTIVATGSTSAAGVRIFKSYPTFIYSTTGTTAANGVNDLLVLNVTASHAGSVMLNKLVFNIAASNATLSQPTFFGPNGSVGTAKINSAGTVITVTFNSSANTSDASVAPGQTKTYTLRGTVALTGAGGTGSIATSLRADKTFKGMLPVASISGSSIIWSPNDYTSSQATDADWTNGYGLGGCFASVGIGNNCTARVIAKGGDMAASGVEIGTPASESASVNLNLANALSALEQTLVSLIALLGL